MKFIQGETVAYPFSISYYGNKADIGSPPTIYAHVFSVELQELIEIALLVDIADIIQVSSQVFMNGTIFIPKKMNTLAVGEYRIKIAIKLPDIIMDLLYAPIEIEPATRSFYVSSINKDNVTPQDVRFHLRNIIDPGVKAGFDISLSQDAFYLNIGPGTMYTTSGIKIEHAGTPKAVKVRRTLSNPRVDAVCIYYNEALRDMDDAVSPPAFRVIEGPDTADYIPPTIPPNYTAVGYVILPANINTYDQIKISRSYTLLGKRPFFNVPSINTGDGVRDLFEFPTEFISGTTEVDVDGVGQVLSEDYEEVDSKMGRSLIKFTDGVPAPGQRVSLSGQRFNGPFYDYDYSIYETGSATLPQARPYPITDMLAEYVASSFATDEWLDTMVRMPKWFSEHHDRLPTKGWAAALGYYLNFEPHTGMKLDLSNLRTAPINPLYNGRVKISMEWNLRDMPVSMNWHRVFSIGSDINLYLLKANEMELRAVFDYGATRLILDMGAGSAQASSTSFSIFIWELLDGRSTFSLKTVSDGTLRYASGSHSSTHSIYDVWTLGNATSLANPKTGNGIYGQLSKLILYSSENPTELF